MLTDKRTDEAQEPEGTTLDDEVADWKGSFKYGIYLVLRGIISTTKSPAVAADEINAIYEEFLQADPLLKFQEDKGMETFLGGFYDALLTNAVHTSYVSSAQSDLIELLVELRKLPLRKVKIWGVC
jgi:hypothetical protein